MPGNFVVEARDGAARVGRHRGIRAQAVVNGVKDAETETPCALLLTKRGSLPNIAAELYPLGSTEAMLQIAVLDFFLLNPNQNVRGAEVLGSFQRGVHKFCGISGKPAVLSFRGAGSQDFLFNVGSRKDALQGELRGIAHRVKVSVDDVIQLQNAMSCDFFEAPSVPALPDASEKHLRGSVERTAHMLRDTVGRRGQCPGELLAPVQGGFDEASRKRSAAEAAAHAGEVAGFVISGLGCGETPRQWESAIRNGVQELPDSLPRFLCGDGSPEKVLAAVELGVDIFDCSYPFEIAEFGVALDLRSGAPLQLNNNEFARDSGPLVRECRCYTCSNHSRGYIHHLLQVHEMLGETLITIHNLHNYAEFLGDVRCAIRQGRFRQFREAFSASRSTEQVLRSAEK